MVLSLSHKILKLHSNKALGIWHKRANGEKTKTISGCHSPFSCHKVSCHFASKTMSWGLLSAWGQEGTSPFPQNPAYHEFKQYMMFYFYNLYYRGAGKNERNGESRSQYDVSRSCPPSQGTRGRLPAMLNTPHQLPPTPKVTFPPHQTPFSFFDFTSCVSNIYLWLCTCLNKMVATLRM